MKKRTLVPFIAIIAAASLVFVPVSGHAGVLDIQKQIDQIAQQEKARQKAKEEADKKVSGINGQIKQEQRGIDDLQKEIDAQSKQKMALEQKIAETNLNLAETSKQREEAEARVASRKSLLESRVRLMYMNGSVSYLDVLLSANSFSDFIDRFQNLKTIVGKDTEILHANERDKEAITQKEAEIKTQLAQVTDMHREKAAIEATLQKNLKQKEVTVASLTKEGQKQENISEEEEAALEKLVKDKQSLYAKLAEEKRKEEAKKKGTSAAAKAVYTGGKLQWPLSVNGSISSEFGYRIDPIKKVNKLHKGLDIAAPKGTPVLAADDGTVILASWVSGYGNAVVVDHNNGLVTWYGHMSAISVSEGDSVKRGGKVGEVGSTGDSTGNHLHFEVRKDNGDTPTNPRPYLGL